MISAANVKIWGKKVGAIAYDEGRGVADFQFENSFLDNGWDLAPIKMPVALAKDRIFSFPELKNSTAFKGIPGLLADVLPDKYGNAIINAWLARNGRPSNSLNPVETLCFIGKRAMGALEFKPVMPKSSNDATNVEIGELVQVAQDILANKENFAADLSDDAAKAMLDILKIGTSAGGARAKAIIAYNPNTKEVKSGQSTAPEGFGHWLIKFDGVQDDQLGTSHGYGRVEMAYYLMAKESGIEMTECRLLEEKTGLIL